MMSLMRRFTDMTAKVNEFLKVCFDKGGRAQKQTPAIKLSISLQSAPAYCICVHWLKGVEVSSPALTSLGPFLWQTFVTLQRAVWCNRLLTTSAVPSLRTAQIPDIAIFFDTQEQEEETENNCMRNTCYDEWKADTLVWSTIVILNAPELLYH